MPDASPLDRFELVAGIAAPEYDVFADLSDSGHDRSGVEAHLWALLRDGGFGLAAGRVLLLLPPGIEPEGVLAGHLRHGAATPLRRALAEASARGRHLLVLVGLLVPGNEAVAALVEALDADPMFGTAQPRFADAATDEVHPLPGGAEAAEPPTPRIALARLPALLVTAELPAACLLLRRGLEEAMGAPEEAGDAAEALFLGLCRARRCGFRNVVANRVVVPSPPDGAYPALAGAAAARLFAAYPDAARAAEENARQPQRRLEALLGAAHPANGAARSLLLDCRGLGELHNGTSRCMLGLLDGLAALAPAWSIDVLCHPGAAAFHDLERRYPGFRHVSGAPAGRYAAALMPNQPWTLDAVAELHRHALVVAFNILDTIGWDVLYPVNDHVAPTWRFIARHADGLGFISRHSRDRFDRRFPIAPEVAQTVAYLSLRAEEQTLAPYRGLPDGDHVLLFGNAYDHKNLAPTLRRLVDAFPLQRFTVLGAVEAPTPMVSVMPSGQADGDTVHRLIATARAIVYPSFYEGFGLPVVEGLGYGRTVLVRRSPIWEEIAGQSRLPGRLLDFSDGASLADTLGRVLAGLPVAALPRGIGLAEDASPTCWSDCAATLLTLAERGLEAACAERWLRRDEALRVADA